ncbi:MAG: FAD/NAD(P)-binding protein [Candidatus Latescibacteria bacterium]|nr:FAD/NAD(P)-binding protein [Candidatus Latescibacterota bacterium]
MANNVYLPEPMRIVRRYDLIDDVRFFQVRPLEMERALQLNYLPGQFMMVSLAGVGEAPFSISSTPSRPGLLEFGIRKVGIITEELFKLKENEVIGVRGPFGNGFPIDKFEKKDLIIVVGGLGAVPLRSLLLYTLDNRDRFGRIFFLYGARRPAEMLFRREFMELKSREDLHSMLTVDKDDTGRWTEQVGLVTALFKNLKDIDPQNTYATVCGPPVMYKFVIDEIIKLGIPKHQILMTLERRMHCGVGKCGHCVIGSIYTCMDGPVFSYWDVMHMKDLI